MNKIELTSFADLAADKRKVKEVFFNQINSIIDWEKIDKLIKTEKDRCKIQLLSLNKYFLTKKAI